MIAYGRSCNIGLAVLWAAAAYICVSPRRVSAGASQDHGAERARIAFSHPLPRMDGNHLAVTVVEVTYGPGESSPPHSHPCPVVGYVVAGAVRMQVKGEPEKTYKAGESFYEAPNGVHLVSANASHKEPAKFVAYFVCDRETPLSVPVPQTKAYGGN
ncbi:MAG: cupin domain-containing protein [Blastocatellia bacterium]